MKPDFRAAKENAGETMNMPKKTINSTAMDNKKYA